MMRIIWITAIVFLCFSFIACQPSEKADTEKEAAIKPAEDEAEKEGIVEPKMVKLEAFSVVGMGVECTLDDTSGIAPLWGSFMEREKEIKHCEGIYGVSFPVGAGFFYMACCRVSKVADIPDGMETRDVPAASYAVFPFYDKVEKMSDEYQKIYMEYMPKAGLKPDFTKPSLEYYAEDCFDEATQKIKAYLYIPIAQ